MMGIRLQEGREARSSVVETRSLGGGVEFLEGSEDIKVFS
jgi:hypothetical protein